MIPPSGYRALERQRAYLDGIPGREERTVDVLGMRLAVHPDVYATSGDTELLAASVRIAPHETFVEIGCGTGAVALSLAQRCAGGVAGDINPSAVANARANAERLGIGTVRFVESDLFAAIEGRFDVAVFNPPYSNEAPRTVADRMFWDPGDEAKRGYLAQVAAHLAPGGRAYLAWANFADVDPELPLRLAAENGLLLTGTFDRPSKRGDFSFYVFEFQPAA